MLNAIIIIVVVVAVLAVLGLRMYRPRGVQPRDDVPESTPPRDRDETWDPRQRYDAQ